MDNKKCQKNTNIYVCKLCKFKCCKYSNYVCHLTTAKHKKTENNNIFNAKYTCKCGNVYKYISGLSRHKKKCVFAHEAEEETEELYQEINIKDKDTIIIQLLKQNEDLHNKIVEMASHTSVTNNTNSHNTTNNSFNLNFFLNETCKDAMNISDFVSSIKVSLSDLENTGRQGYIEGISSIIVKNLNKVEKNLRPIHCSDVKREVFYIKDNNEWQKENEEKPILTKAIKVIANENIKLIQNWRDKYPDCIDSDSKKNNLYLKIVSNSMNGSTQEESHKNIDKIISNVAKEVIINKT
jgi:hypothetical protein